MLSTCYYKLICDTQNSLAKKKHRSDYRITLDYRFFTSNINSWMRFNNVAHNECNHDILTF